MPRNADTTPTTISGAFTLSTMKSTFASCVFNTANRIRITPTIAATTSFGLMLRPAGAGCGCGSSLMLCSLSTPRDDRRYSATCGVTRNAAWRHQAHDALPDGAVGERHLHVAGVHHRETPGRHPGDRHRVHVGELGRDRRLGEHRRVAARRDEVGD